MPRVHRYMFLQIVLKTYRKKYHIPLQYMVIHMSSGDFKLIHCLKAIDIYCIYICIYVPSVLFEACTLGDSLVCDSFNMNTSSNNCFLLQMHPNIVQSLNRHSASMFAYQSKNLSIIKQNWYDIISYDMIILEQNRQIKRNIIWCNIWTY